MSDDDKGSAAMRGSLDAIKGVDAGPKAAERLFLGTSKHDGSPEPTAHLPHTVHAGCRSRESDAGTGDTIGRWIPVTERLPPEGVDVLVSSPCPNSDTPNIDIASWGNEGAREPVWREADCGRIWPTHWMPLPAPPTDAK